LSIAGKCNLNLYILNLSSVDEDSLHELYTDLPARCVILLEDIDAVNTIYSRQSGTVVLGGGKTTSSTKEKPEGKVSLSTLLNAIDSVASQQGQLLIITTNHIDRLDPALIRPGRVDIKVELRLTNKDINSQFFLRIFGCCASDKNE
jgi:chaperone BCS1